MKNNYTLNFKNIVDKVLGDNRDYFAGVPKDDMKNRVLGDFDIDYSKPYFYFDEIFKKHIEDFILNEENCDFMDLDILQKISK